MDNYPPVLIKFLEWCKPLMVNLARNSKIFDHDPELPPCEYIPASKVVDTFLKEHAEFKDYSDRLLKDAEQRHSNFSMNKLLIVNGNFTAWFYMMPCLLRSALANPPRYGC